MRTVVAWSDRVPDRDGIKSVVYSIAYRPDGSQLVAAVGNRVMVYDAVDGDLQHSLKGHKDTVYCVDYSRDGKRFASGGADKTIIIWTFKAEGILKYAHNDAIQYLAYNPVTQQLASVTHTDFGLWSPEQKSVSKHKVSSRILCASWTNDGQYLALGMFNGQVGIRDKNGQEKVLIPRNAPVWTLAWNPSRDEPFDILAVGCWDQTLSFYQLSGIQVGKDRPLKFDPCCVSYFSDGEYLLVAGSDKKVTLRTKEGVRLTTIAEKEDWVWCARNRPKQNYVAVGCNDGTISTYQLIFSTVHGLYQDRYAYRDKMTDVIIQHLITDQKVRIKCRDYVTKIAVFRDRLAVQLPDRVIIYELSHEDAYDMLYRVREKIQQKLECNLLVVTSLHIILCQEKKLQLYNFEGHKEREWILESVIRYIKVIGGPSGKEGLLVGLKSGLVLKIFIDNPFPIQLIRHKVSIRCLDLSASRRKLAIVDENANVTVYDVHTKELVFQDSNANSVAWNSEFEEMFCWSGNGVLNIKTGDFPLYTRKLQGFVVGFKGSKIFCLHYASMQTIDVPQSASLYRYIEKKDWDNAYKVACLGVTESDWKLLAMEALASMSLEIARKAFIRVRDMRYIELLNNIELARKMPGHDDSLFVGEVLAYQGKYQEAAKMFAKANKADKAIEMFTDLRQWDDAKRWASQNEGISVKDLIRQQADWSSEVNDLKGAAEMYIAAGEYVKAIQILGDKASIEELIELVRTLNKMDTQALGLCAHYLRKAGNHQYARETYLKMNDMKALMELHVEFQKWDEAFGLLRAHPQYKELVYLPYANWLALADRFDEAQDAFKLAGRPEAAAKMLEQLSHNAVMECRFADAAYYFFMLAHEKLKLCSTQVSTPYQKLPAADQQHVDRYYEFLDLSELYYAYHLVYKYTVEPFTATSSETLFNATRFLMNRLVSYQSTPLGIRKVYVLYAMAKLAKQLGAFKLARIAYEKLQHLTLPPAWKDQVELNSIMIRSKPFSDPEELLPICYRCSQTNHLVNDHGDMCATCMHPVVRSYLSFDHLPLVEFILDDGISDDEAQRLINMEPPTDTTKKKAKGGDGWRETDAGSFQALRLDADDEPDEDILNNDNPFTQQLMNYYDAERDCYLPIRADARMLQSFPRDEIFVVKNTAPLRTRYFRTMLPDLPITLKNGHFFHEEDYEASILQKHHPCPFLRTMSPKEN
eukprot:TRINITY_DN7858_c0_g1::TRINITY_DN7858_c0_g1_i1::g.23657::m.23657 TRINITY_DN7858_c0_g1::TRINITY_DN7858_c0_g1_i1::g.23657  ORF type:complete len:1206 (-),score=375.70,sp/A8WGF4/IF122_XENTR/55.15/0.0,WD40/PF00400.27/1e+02,WD40/PF00400.27/1.8e-10,WD40/PF00400.27/5.9e+02,WD40/PF00400.27/14,WD40/PF00400.27/0.33,WD40/PF00400.27/13,WD40/PF00400.27/0.039,WD40/PF00400.27/1.9e+02,Coatomer_WDAD/PF04053.9/43,Coatomer_WDAD/PF04053.9/56,Coatomer_WDAD/PF04053.9/70,Coatomer_WDAD/PF04053.9/0.32,Coatomer_WDAD/PF040